MRHKEISYSIPIYQKNHSLYKIPLRKFGPKSNLDVPDENHTKGLLTESKKLNFKRWISLPQIAAHSTLHNSLYQS
jgi:hypothetical protein